MYYNMTPPGAAGWAYPLVEFHWTIVANIKRDPFEQAVLLGDAKTLANVQGALTSPSTAYIYDWNMLPIGQLLWEKELMSYKTFPPLQAPETYNLDGILKAIQAGNHPSD
jgi:arylsulfatase